MPTPDPVHLARAFDRRLKLGIGVLTGCALLGIAVLRGADLVADRRQALAAGERRASNLALILGEYLRGTFLSADASLRQLALHGRRVGGAGAPPGAWHEVLRSARAALTGIGSLSIVDRDGIIRHSTLDLIAGQSRRDTYVFQTLARSPGDVLVADTPFRSVAGSERIMIPLGRRITTEDGSFDGIVVATFFPEELRGFFHKVELGPGGVVSVFHPGGFVLFREPSDKNPIGESAAGNAAFEAAARAGRAGVIRGPIRPGRNMHAEGEPRS